jgi:hypothetical protein
MTFSAPGGLGNVWRYRSSASCGQLRSACKMDQLAVEAKDAAERAVAQPHAAARNSIEHWLDVGGRGTDDAQDLAGRRLLLQRLLRFVEQSHVLDGDHGLIGEGLEQLQLPVGNGFTSVRRNWITPNAAPSRISGTLTIVRKPNVRAACVTSGNSSSFDFSRIPSIMEERATAYQALFFRSLQLEGVFPDSKTVNGIILRHTDAKWAADMSDLPPACKAEPKPLASPEAVRERIAEIPTALALSSECDRQLLVAAAAKLVAEHRDEILEFLNRP